MKKESIVLGMVGLLIGIIITGFVAGYSVNHGFSGMMRAMGIDTTRMAGGNIDRHFIEQMIPHHESAIAMARLAQEKSNRSEIKTLADSIIATQADEIEKMRSLYQQWYGTSVPKRDVLGGMMHDTGYADTLNSAKDFDKAFLEEMIPHHQMAIMMAGMLENNTNRQEMRSLARDITVAQSKEVDTMRDWQVRWGYETSARSSGGMMH